jgi:hypothetical protein
VSTDDTHTRPVSRREQRIARRALKHLRTALAEAGDQLTADWVARDPDLQELLRESEALDPEWTTLIAQVKEARHEKPLTAEVPRTDRAAVAIEIPPDPWPPAIPILFWLAVTGAFVGLLALALSSGAYWMFKVAVAVSAVAAVYRLLRAIGRPRERRRMFPRVERRVSVAQQQSTTLPEQTE